MPQPSRIDETLSALADPTRRQVIELLRAGPLRAGELAERSGMSRPAMSRHLKILLRSGLLLDERVAEDARIRLFRLRPEALDELGDWVEATRAFWTDQLASFKKHAEGRSS
ncbi:MAG: metalloregulator ArsR/SmtB family transcription factor [Acidobacteriota bacterium]